MACPCQIDESSRFWDSSQGAFYELGSGALGDGVLYAPDSAQQVLYSWAVPGFAGPTLEYTAAANHLILETVVAPDGAVYTIEVDTAPAPDVYKVRRVLPTATTLHTFAAGVSPASLGWTTAGELVMYTGPSGPANDSLITMDPATGTPTTLASGLTLAEVIPTLDGGLWTHNQNRSFARRNAAGTVTMSYNTAGSTTYVGMIPQPGDTDSVITSLVEGSGQNVIVHPSGAFDLHECTTAVLIGDPLEVARLWNADQSLIWQVLRTSSQVLRIDDWTNPCDRRWWVGTTGFSA